MSRSLGLSPQSQILVELAFHVAIISCLCQNSAMTGGWRTLSFFLNWCRNTIWSKIWGFNILQQNFMYRCTIEGFYQLTWHKTHRLVDSVELWKVCLWMRACLLEVDLVQFLWQWQNQLEHLPLISWPRIPRDLSRRSGSAIKTGYSDET